MRSTLHGFMTVEATLIMPMVWFAVFFIIFVGFFQYDRCIAEQDGKMIALRAADMRGRDEATVIRTVMERGELAGTKKLLFSDGVERKLHVTKDQADIKISGRVNTILNSLVKDKTFHFFSYETEYEVKKYDPVHLIRTCRRMINGGGD